MCGICGGIGPKSPDRAALMRQLASIAHRGPDDQGFFIEPEISLGMCRLAIVEISAGKQPASDQSKRVQLVFNGEIYNYRELRESLSGISRGASLISESDVIIQLYLAHGISFVSKLNGMFAIAIYDSRDNSLHLFRDRMGKKPLWLLQDSDGSLFFASEVRALLQIRPECTLRTGMISEVMQLGYINSPASAFNEIQQLPPASVLTWKDKKTSSLTYWEPNFDSKTGLSYDEAVETTKDLIEAAVSRRLVAERPIGSFLSGGYDSTVVTAYMAKLMTEPVQTYSIGFNSHRFNEAPYAKEIAKYLGTQHHEEIINPDPALIVGSIARTLDQPFADSSIIPTYLLAKFARENLVVALGGDGGDEIFGGYDRYRFTPLLQSLNPYLKIIKSGVKVSNLTLQLIGKREIRKGELLKSMASLSDRYLAIQSLTQGDALKGLLNDEFLEDTHTDNFLSHIKSKKFISNLDLMVASDLKHYLPGDLLVKADIASMAHSLELRSPLLDNNVVEWGIALPEKFRIQRNEGKHILKDVARSLVPPLLIDRPKMGFAIPRAEWLRTGLKEMLIDVLTDTTARNRGWFNQRSVQLLINKHMAGSNQDQTLWPILMLELWARNWLD